MADIGRRPRTMCSGFAGNLLRLARIERGWSQRQLAAEAGVAHSTVARIESGAVQPSLPSLARLLAAADLELRLRLEQQGAHIAVTYRQLNLN